MPEIHGLGHSMKRKEDPRFIRGKGNYIDDMKLPGMLHLDIVRSPYAHAKIKKINGEKALAVPGVLAVITGETLKQFNVHNMPTLMSDTQMVLPLDTVKYQYQEVAAVLATDRYTAADGVAAVEVEYESLPVVADPKKAHEPGAPKVRDDKPSITSGTGSGAIVLRPTKPSPRPRSRSKKTSTSPASTSHRLRPAGAWRSGTRWRAI